MPASDSFTIREAVDADRGFLWEMLAASISDVPPWTVERARATPDVAHYLEGWGRPGDLALVAAVDDTSASGAGDGPDQPDGPRPLGAAWCRRFTVDDAGYGFVADDVPELSVALVPDARGRGVGRALVEAILARVHTAGHDRISLSVDPANSVAARLYESLGFDAVGPPDAGGSVTMVALTRPPMRPPPCGTR